MLLPIHHRLYILVLIASLAATGCGPQQQTQQPGTKALPADGSYNRVMDRMISLHDVQFSPEPVEAGTGYDYPGEGGYQPARTRYFFFGKKRFALNQVDVIGGPDSLRYQQLRFETDTAALFTYKGKPYGWAKAFMYGCNGKGCEEEFHFIADFEKGRLHAFNLRSMPRHQWYFGDLDGDEDLDVLLPRRMSNRRTGIRSSEDTVTLAVYAFQTKGKYLIPLTDGDGEHCFWILQFDNSYYAPRNCRILGSTF